VSRSWVTLTYVGHCVFGGRTCSPITISLRNYGSATLRPKQPPLALWNPCIQSTMLQEPPESLLRRYLPQTTLPSSWQFEALRIDPRGLPSTMLHHCTHSAFPGRVLTSRIIPHCILCHPACPASQRSSWTLCCATIRPLTSLPWSIVLPWSITRHPASILPCMLPLQQVAWSHGHPISFAGRQMQPPAWHRPPLATIHHACHNGSRYGSAMLAAMAVIVRVYNQVTLSGVQLGHSRRC